MDHLHLRIAAREAALRRALRQGSAIDAARAAGRVRVEGTSLPGRTMLDGRAVRARFGRALRTARRRRSIGMPAPTVAVPIEASLDPTGRRATRSKLVASITAVALLLLIITLWRPAAEPQAEPGGGGQPAAVRVAVSDVLRGRTIAIESSPPAVELAEPTSAPEPEVAAPAAASTSRTTTATGVGGGTGSRGTGTGSGSGSGSGSGAATPARTAAPTPAPTPAPTLPPVTSTSAALTIIVVDANGQPVPGVCLIVGTGTCTTAKPHTDANGAWTTVVPISTPTLAFDIMFVKTGYNTNYGRFTLRQGQTASYTVRLYPAGSGN